MKTNLITIYDHMSNVQIAFKRQMTQSWENNEPDQKNREHVQKANKKCISELWKQKITNT